jgi:general secretion pathway protein I
MNKPSLYFQPQIADQRGFTLLEVLIALTILAVLATAVMTQTGTSINQLQRLEQKTSALWIAEYQMNRLRVADNWPALGRSSSIIDYADQQWQVNTEVSTTSEPWLRKIELSVGPYSVDLKQIPSTSLTAYRGRY